MTGAAGIRHGLPKPPGSGSPGTPCMQRASGPEQAHPDWPSVADPGLVGSEGHKDVSTSQGHPACLARPCVASYLNQIPL